MVSHPLILAFYRITGIINLVLSVFHKKTTIKNYENNNNVELKLEEGFIEDQRREEGLRYGSFSFSHSGCATAAVFNALYILGIPQPLPSIIRYFEKHGASSFARFGTAPQSAVRFLKKKGLKVKKTASSRRFKELAESSDVILFTIMNDRKRLRSMLHTMCIERRQGDGSPSPSPRRQGDGSPSPSPVSDFIVHNSHGSAETYGSFNEMMASLGEGNGSASGVYMIGINKSLNRPPVST